MSFHAESIALMNFSTLALLRVAQWCAVCEYFDWDMMCESQKFAATGKSFRINGMDELESHCLKAVCFVFDDMLFVFYNLMQFVSFIGSEGGQEKFGIFRTNKQEAPVEKAVEVVSSRISQYACGLSSPWWLGWQEALLQVHV